MAGRGLPSIESIKIGLINGYHIQMRASLLAYFIVASERLCRRESLCPWVAVTFCLFVRDGIHSVADYNSTLMGVVVVVVVVVVRFFHDGITRERLELSS